MVGAEGRGRAESFRQEKNRRQNFRLHPCRASYTHLGKQFSPGRSRDRVPEKSWR